MVSDKTKGALINLLFNGLKVAVKAKGQKPAEPMAEVKADRPKAQNTNLSGCCDKKKVK